MIAVAVSDCHMSFGPEPDHEHVEELLHAAVEEAAMMLEAAALSEREKASARYDRALHEFADFVVRGQIPPWLQSYLARRLR